MTYYRFVNLCKTCAISGGLLAVYGIITMNWSERVGADLLLGGLALVFTSWASFLLRLTWR